MLPVGMLYKHLTEDTIEPSVACLGLSPWSSCA